MRKTGLTVQMEIMERAKGSLRMFDILKGGTLGRLEKLMM